MTDETPNAEGEPSPATPEEAPTAETKPLTDDAAVPKAGDEDDVAPAPAAAAAPNEPDATQANPVAPAPAPTAAAAATAPAERPAGIFIPKWLGLVAAAIIAALVFGGIGYAIGDSSSSSGSSQNASVFPGTGTANGNGNGPFGNGRQFPNGSELPGGTINGNGNSNGNSGNSNGNGNSNGGGQSTSNGAFLGVAVGTADNGVAVTEVQSGSPAADAGLKQGDVITAIDGTKVTTPLAVRNAVQQHSSGDQITITYTRGGTSSTTKATLTSRSTSQSS
jgi:membrane-associated protease RseP (regulator of RpoE activity)